MTPPTKPTDPKLNLALARSLNEIRAGIEPNATCPFPGCGARWFSSEFQIYDSVDVATMCPRCKQGVRLRKRNGTEEYGTCVTCGGEVHPRQIWDMPFAVDFSEKACLRCNIVRHLTRKYPDQVQAALEGAIPQEPAPADEPEPCRHLSFRITARGSECVDCGRREDEILAEENGSAQPTP